VLCAVQNFYFLSFSFAKFLFLMRKLRITSIEVTNEHNILVTFFLSIGWIVVTFDFEVCDMRVTLYHFISLQLM
jgi:hypothetical protein